MALDPILWAMKDAPVANVEEWAVLTVMAESADEDGCNAFQATETIAERAKLSKRTAQRRIDDLATRGVIVSGDQQYAPLLRIPQHKRPHNYDLCIPLAWFGSADRVNEWRDRQGRTPLTHASRPALAPAPEKKKRADAGVKRGQAETLTAEPVQAADADGGRGDYKSPPDFQSPHDLQAGGDSQTPQGVTTSHPVGRQAVTQPSPSTHPLPTPKDPATLRDAEAAELVLVLDENDDTPQPPSVKDRARALTTAWWDRLPEGGKPVMRFPAAMKILEGAIGNGIDESVLKRALDGLGQHNPTLTAATLNIEVQKVRGNGRTPWQRGPHVDTRGRDERSSAMERAFG